MNDIVYTASLALTMGVVVAAFFFGRRSAKPGARRVVAATVKPRLDQLPCNLIVRNGALVTKDTGEVPSLVPFEGMEVNVVPHYDLKRELIQAALFRLAQRTGPQPATQN